MDLWENAFDDWQQGMKYKDIAAKHGVSESAVKSRVSRDWKRRKIATKSQKKSQPPKAKSQPKEKKLRPGKVGAPPGSQNAKGNSGGSAPIGNKNSFKHGIYEEIYWDSLDENEKRMIQAMELDKEESLLEQQILLLSVRERRLLHRIDDARNAKGGLALDSVISRKLEIENIFEINDEVVKDAKRSQTHNETTTRTISTFDVIQRLEAELTRVQGRKTRCIQALNKLRTERRKLNEDGKLNAVDQHNKKIETLSSLLNNPVGNRKPSDFEEDKNG